MVDVSQKPETERKAVASAMVRMQPTTLELILNQQISKGDVLGIARVAGINGSKRTSDLIPLCHPLRISSVDIDFRQVNDSCIQAEATVQAIDRTGVEMEALTAVTTAALTIYDMCKAVDREMTITKIQLEEKTGGKSGAYQRTE
jgi:cyclic pyranopterin phosphate synthase